MQTRLNLRRNSASKLLAGMLIAVTGTLMLVFADGEAGRIIFGALVAAAGLALATRRDYLCIDKAEGVVIHRRGYVLPWRHTRYPVSKIRGVNVSVQTVGGGDDRKTVYPVHLSGINGAVVSNGSNPVFARVIAERLARRLRVPMRNRVFGPSTHRSPEELDMPLVRRWQRDGQRFARPTLPGNTRLRESQDAARYTLRIPAQYPSLKYVAFLLLVAVLPAAYAATLGGEFGGAFFGFVAFFALLGGILMLALVGRSTLTVAEGAVTFRQGYFPLRSNLRIAEIEEMVVAADGITLIGDRGTLWVHWGGSKPDSDYLQAMLPYQISRHALPEMG